MKKYLVGLFMVLGSILVLALALMPLGGLVFMATLAAAAVIVFLNIVGLGSHSITDPTFTYLQIAWKIYLVGAFITLFVVFTWSFQNCCIGLQTLRSHIVHKGWDNLEPMFYALTWPYSVFAFDRFLQGWLSSWIEASANALEYWFYSAWHPTKAVFLDLKQGVITEVTVSPDNAVEVLRDWVEDSMEENT